MDSIEKFSAVTQLYVGLFGVAPDVEGLNYWALELDKGASIGKVASAMLGTASGHVFYPNANDYAGIISAFYQNALGRQADESGLDYWSKKAIGGEPIGDVLAEMLHVASHYDGNDPEGLQSQLTFAKKVEAADIFASQFGKHGGINQSTLTSQISHDMLGQVTAATDVNEFAATVFPSVWRLMEAPVQVLDNVGQILPNGSLAGLLSEMPKGSTLSDAANFALIMASNSDYAEIGDLIFKNGGSFASVMDGVRNEITPEQLLYAAKGGAQAISDILNEIANNATQTQLVGIQHLSGIAMV
ncbi:hypothetical protein [Extensimonas sp. H3M7-6]|uniref:hypothetical protein n=1 Tax=Extensimonas soli TaxID=3031322 RepID=UPI0023DB882D|nr:hypothetical protein [Extensimonas sp. H3M7-6]MDF1482051.1 hypothetical protein [Extensimonas sp. H3M7-6]